MTTQQFYLLGDQPSSARPIEVDGKLDIEGLKRLIAAHFAIVQPNGEFNHSSLQNQLLDSA